MSVLCLGLAIWIMKIDFGQGGLLYYKQRFSSVFDVKGHIFEKLKKEAAVRLSKA